MEQHTMGNQRGRRAYFAASNSEQGFCSRYEACFRTAAERTWIIKGGPGTGKSRMMWDMVAAGERAGYQAELYLCSSDPDSLDAVLLRRGAGESLLFLDGTAPHEMELREPGIREQLVDLGAFWSQETLMQRALDIRALMAQKQACYACAYRYLRGAGACHENMLAIMQDAIVRGAVDRLAARLFAGATLGDGTAERAQPRYLSTCSLGMKGWVSLSTFAEAAQRICRLERCHGVEYAVLAALVERAVQSGEAVVVSCHPVFCHCYDAVFFERSGVAVLLEEEREDEGEEDGCYSRTVKLRRLLNPTVLRERRAAWREGKRLCDALLQAAERCLREAARPHFALESIYGEAMDFAAKEAYSHRLAAQLFGE